MTQQASAIAVQGIGFTPRLIAVDGFTATGVAPTNDLTSAKYQQSRAQKLRANLGVKWGSDQKREEPAPEPLTEQPKPEPVLELVPARRTLAEGGLRLTLAAAQPKIDAPAPAPAVVIPAPAPLAAPKSEPADLTPLVKKLFKRIQAAEDATLSLERRMTEHVDTLRRRLQESEDQRIAAERLVAKLMREKD